jgi:DNA-binding MarR family transcriptional regulator
VFFMNDLALGRALTLALRHLVDDMHERLAADGFDDLRPAFGYVLNAAASSAMNASDIAALLGMTKQGAAKLLVEMQTAGYVVRRDSESDGRVRRIELTDRGRQALAAAERAQAEIEEHWAHLTSRNDTRALRRVLDAVVTEASADGTPPPLRPAW